VAAADVGGADCCW